MSETDEYTEHACDLCGSDEAAEIECLNAYSGGQAIHACKGCGFVYVRRRRSARRIAAVWSDDLYGGEYTARIPAVRARQVYVAETLDQAVPLRGLRLCDIGAGEGDFVQMLGAEPYGARPFGIEPSRRNCERMRAQGTECFDGTIEEYVAAGAPGAPFDVVTVLWTLENCMSCVGLLRAARELLAPGGTVCVATGSRILVPFKKPLDCYVGTLPADTHAFRFSAATLRGALAEAGLVTRFVNRHIDNDILCVLGEAGGDETIEWRGDDWRQVVDFFERWDHDSREHFPAPDREAPA